MQISCQFMPPSKSMSTGNFYLVKNNKNTSNMTITDAR